MRRVLLVDDEKYIRLGLKAMLAKLDTVFQEVYECGDGWDALNLVRENKFDLIILDIKMPCMSGIEFMKQAIAYGCTSKFIILSGYDEFEYAQESIKYGTRAYLLKPVKRQELLTVLKKLESELKAEEIISYSTQKAELLIQKFQVHELNYILLNENISEKEIEDIFSNIEPRFYGKNFVLGLLCNYETDGSSQLQPEDIAMKVAVDFYFQDKEGICLRFFDKEKNLVILGEDHKTLYGLPAYLKETSRVDSLLSVSTSFNSTIHLRKAYIEALEAKKYRVLKTGIRVFRYDELCRPGIPGDNSEVIARKLAGLLHSPHIKEIEDTLYELLNPQVLSICSIQYLENIVDNMNKIVLKPMKKYFCDQKEEVIQQYDALTSIYHFKDVKEYYYTLLNCLLKINAQLQGVQTGSRTRSEIETAVRLIRDNYHRDLDMAEVANKVFLNYTYFSLLFKEHTGYNFAEYLKNVRIEKAKELLENTFLKVYEIAKSVGYQSTKQFVRNFRFSTGVSPMEYRKRPVKELSE